jgi:8-amino-7-oxononanoate synthase
MKMYQDLIKADNFSYLREIESGSENIVIVNGEKLINLCSNNYLGMTTHPKVIDEGVIALKKYGVGSGGARFVGGTMDLHNELERRLARFKGGEDCVIFSTGYTMNIATISLLANQNDYLVVDKKAHASIIDGCKLSGANTIFYKHNDMNDLEKILKKLGTEKSKMIITEGVFSMDGDISSLDEIYKLGEKYNAPVMIDDAHGSGVLGKNGSGTASHFGLEGKISVIAGTLSKAFGCVGGYVVANKEIIRCLKHYSRGFVFTTSLPPTVIASLIKVVDVFETEPEWQEKLWENIKYIRRSLLQLGFKLTDTNSAIIPVILGEDKFAHLFVKRLQEEGIFVSPAAYPAVPKNEARLRVSLMATHTRLQLEIFVSTMEKLGKEYKII